jgi:hypothetical protein
MVGQVGGGIKRGVRPTVRQKRRTAGGPVHRPADWVEFVNEPPTVAERLGLESAIAASGPSQKGGRRIK